MILWSASVCTSLVSNQRGITRKWEPWRETWKGPWTMALSGQQVHLGEQAPSCQSSPYYQVLFSSSPNQHFIHSYWVANSPLWICFCFSERPTKQGWLTVLATHNSDQLQSVSWLLGSPGPTTASLFNQGLAYLLITSIIWVPFLQLWTCLSSSHLQLLYLHEKWLNCHVCDCQCASLPLLLGEQGKWFSFLWAPRLWAAAEQQVPVGTTRPGLGVDRHAGCHSASHSDPFSTCEFLTAFPFTGLTGGSIIQFPPDQGFSQLARVSVPNLGVLVTLPAAAGHNM